MIVMMTMIKNDDGDKSKHKKKYTPAKEFHREVQEQIRDSIQYNHHVDTIVIEINSLKLIYNQTFVDCIKSILSALLTLVDVSLVNLPKGNELLIDAMRNMLKRWKDLFTRFITTPDDQAELIYSLEDFCEKNKFFEKYFTVILQILYDSDIIEEDTILQWAERVKDSDSKEEEKYIKQADKFLQWLREAEEDDEEEDA